MNIFKNIKESKYQVELLKGQMSYIKDQKRLDRLVVLINSIINLINSVEGLVDKQLNTDIVDKLLLARMYSQIYPLECTTEKLNIHKIVSNIDCNISEPSEMLKNRLVNSLITKEQTHVLSVIPKFKGDNGLIKIDYSKFSKKEANAALQKLKTLTLQSEYSRMIDGLLIEFKDQIRWN